MGTKIKNIPLELESRAVYYAWILNYNVYGLALSGRNKQDSFARMAIWWHLCDDGFSCRAISDLFNKNHSSIIHGRNMVNDAIDLPKCNKLLHCNWKRIADRKHRYEHASFINQNIWVCLERA